MAATRFGAMRADYRKPAQLKAFYFELGESAHTPVADASRGRKLVRQAHELERTGGAGGACDAMGGGMSWVFGGANAECGMRNKLKAESGLQGGANLISCVKVLSWPLSTEY